MKQKIIELLQATRVEGIDNLIAAMEEMGFFEAPCSGSYHLSKPGGLAEHSLNVFHCMVKLNVALPGTPYDAEAIILTALLHDLGKVGDFGKPNYVPNILKNGKVSEAKPYETNKDLLYIDHAIRSVIIAERYIKLTEEQEHAIIYHNGKYTHIGYDLKETPLMMMLHFADLWSSRVTEIEETEE